MNAINPIFVLFNVANFKAPFQPEQINTVTMPSPFIPHSSFVKSFCQIQRTATPPTRSRCGFIWIAFRPMICDNCSRFVVHFMDYFFCHTLTFTYRNVLPFNMADDAVLLILQNHGERLTSIENDVHDIRTGIEQIKDSPIFAIERYVRRKVGSNRRGYWTHLACFHGFYAIDTLKNRTPHQSKHGDSATHCSTAVTRRKPTSPSTPTPKTSPLPFPTNIPFFAR